MLSSKGDELRLLFSYGNFEFQRRHLLVILVLGLAFTCAFTMRYYPVKYGFHLNEADPFFNYRATKYFLDNGLDAYWNWHDNMSWYPEGRDISKSSQSALHLITASLYLLFAQSLINLMDFTIIFPVILGALTTIVIFVLVRKITEGSNTAGMFSALIFAFAPTVIQRGNLGWFKSEPLGLILGLLALYLFLYAIHEKKLRHVIFTSVLAGATLGLANASWGGIQYFSVPLSIFIVTLPFIRRDLTTSVYACVIFTVVTLLSAALFPRPGISLVFGLGGISLMGSTVFLLNSHFIKKIVEPGKQKYATIILLALFIVFGFAALSAGSYHTSDFRYLNAISPFFSPKTSFTEIVAEHQVPTFVDFFTYHSVVLFFAGLGVWIAFSRKKETYIFALILAILGVYVSSGLVRLLVYSTIGIIILAGIALAEITRAILQKESARFRATKRSHTIGSQDNIKSRTKDWAVSISYICIIIFILLIPLLYPTNSNWLSLADYPPTIIGSPDSSTETSNDWLYALNWISNHTPKNAVIAAWWDYGYWITTMGNRTSFADNATINQTKIATIAKMFIESPEKGLQIAHELKADYILIYVVAHPVLINGKQLYVLGSGGDESIVPSMIGLSRLDESKYISKNVFTDQFWNSTLIGNLIPFERKGYVDRENLQNATLFQEFKQGYSPVYEKAIKFPATSTVNNDSLNLVYSSPSFEKAYDKNNLQNSTINTVLIYQMT